LNILWDFLGSLRILLDKKLKVPYISSVFYIFLVAIIIIIQFIVTENMVIETKYGHYNYIASVVTEELAPFPLIKSLHALLCVIPFVIAFIFAWIGSLKGRLYWLGFLGLFLYFCFINTLLFMQTDPPYFTPISALYGMLFLLLLLVFKTGFKLIYFEAKKDCLRTTISIDVMKLYFTINIIGVVILIFGMAIYGLPLLYSYMKKNPSHELLNLLIILTFISLFFLSGLLFRIYFYVTAIRNLNKKNTLGYMLALILITMDSNLTFPSFIIPPFWPLIHIRFLNSFFLKLKKGSSPLEKSDIEDNT
jgi:hypothetical protein